MLEELEDKEQDLKALDTTLTKLLGDKYYGVTQKREVDPVSFISTDCYSLDRVLGGGIPEGRLLEFSGDSSTSKTTLALNCVAAYQRQGKVCAWLDAESCFDPSFAEACGVDVEKLALIKDCECAEDYLEALKVLCKNKAVRLTVLDSVSALVPRETIEKPIEGSSMAIIARYMSKILPELCPIMSTNNSSLILINQMRATMKMYGASLDTGGGNAIKFYSSIRLRTSKKDIIKKDGEEVGIVIEAKTIKNKVHRPFISRELHVYFPHIEGDKEVAGIDSLGDIIDAGFERGIIKGSKAWMEFPEGNKINGRDKMRTYLQQNPDVLELIVKELKDGNTKESKKSKSKDT